MDSSYHYQGGELELFRDATNWKQYFSRKIRPFIGQRVLEVGAGIGATTRVLNDGQATSWTLLEPDPGMAAQLESTTDFPDNTSIVTGDLSSVADVYDTILYIDVLEHIEKDSEELQKAAGRLQPKGHLIVLAPAFQFLFSEFDKEIGHFRRYRKKQLLALAPASMRSVSAQYLDATGFLASVMNRWVLHQRYPTKKQVRFWDRTLVPLSKFLDPLVFHSFGKTILVVWQKEGT